MGKTKRHEKRWGSGKRPVAKKRHHKGVKHLKPTTLDHIEDNEEEFKYLDDLIHEDEVMDKYRSKH